MRCGKVKQRNCEWLVLSLRWSANALKKFVHGKNGGVICQITRDLSEKRLL